MIATGGSLVAQTLLSVLFSHFHHTTHYPLLATHSLLILLFITSLCVVFLRFLEFKIPFPAPPSLSFQSLPDTFAHFDRGVGSDEDCLPRLPPGGTSVSPGTARCACSSPRSLGKECLRPRLQSEACALFLKTRGCMGFLPILELPHGVRRLGGAVSSLTTYNCLSIPNRSAAKGSLPSSSRFTSNLKLITYNFRQSAPLMGQSHA